MKKLIKSFSLVFSVITLGTGGFYLGSRDQIIEISPPKIKTEIAIQPKNADTKATTDNKDSVSSKPKKTISATAPAPKESAKAETAQTQTPTSDPAPQPETKMS